MVRAHYRGKTIKNEDWITGYLFRVWEDCYICWGTTNDVPNMTRVYKDTVGACTGLLDKNGIYIFEGDIVRTEYGRLCEVKWYESNGHCGWDLVYHECPGNLKTTPPSPSTMFSSSFLEVVGNIHDGLPEPDIGTVYFDDGDVENILRLYDGNGDISKKDVDSLDSFMFTTESGCYRFGYCLRTIGNDSSVFYYKKPVFEKCMPNENLWYPVKNIEKVELKN